MKVTVKSKRPITSEDMRNVAESLIQKYGAYGLDIRDITLYVRFQNASGNLTEPTSHGKEIEHTITLRQ